VQAPPITSHYTYLACSVFSLSSADECDAFHTTSVEVPPFDSPFHYSYLCSSALLTSYVPVYVYTYSMLLISPIAFRLLMRAELSFLPKQALSALPGVLWPSLWDVHSDGSNSDRDSNMKPHFLLKVDGIVASSMHHTAVCLTFGLACPALALVIAAAVVFSALQWTLVINRFIFNRLLSLGMFEDTSQLAVKTKMVRAYLSDCRDKKAEKTDNPSSRCTQAPFFIDKTALAKADSTASLAELEMALAAADAGLHDCLWPVLISASVFVAFICWDMAGDKVRSPPTTQH
jgi:hypothetical protein